MSQLVEEIQTWAMSNYEKMYGAQVIVECFSQNCWIVSLSVTEIKVEPRTGACMHWEMVAFLRT